MAVRVSAEDFDAKVVQSELPVIVEFYSDSCIPCKQLSPTPNATRIASCRRAEDMFSRREKHDEVQPRNHPPPGQVAV